MARGINKVILVGNLGADPETKYMPSGDAITNLRIATSDTWTDKSSGQKQERTEWHRVVMFKKLAEIAAEYLRKGSQVYIEGSLRTRKWQDKEGRDQYTTEIVASEMQMLGGKGGGDAPARASPPGRRRSRAGRPPAPPASTRTPRASTPAPRRARPARATRRPRRRSPPCATAARGRRSAGAAARRRASGGAP